MTEPKHPRHHFTAPTSVYVRTADGRIHSFSEVAGYFWRMVEGVASSEDQAALYSVVKAVFKEPDSVPPSAFTPTEADIKIVVDEPTRVGRKPRSMK